MASSLKISALCVTPSPYQRDFFKALYQASEGGLEVTYLEAFPDDSPWGEPELESWERIAPGKVVGKGRVRSHWNPGLPRPDENNHVLINTQITALTTQLFTRDQLRNRKWWFWGESLNEHAQFTRRFAQDLSLRFLKNCTGIFAVGEVAAIQYRARTGKENVTNLPYAPDLSPYLANPTSPQEPPTFLFCGQMIARKGIDTLLSAWEKVHAASPESRLLLCGRETDALDQIKQLPTSTRASIESVGFLSPTELPAVFARANTFVLPSRHDGWGVVVNQAMAAGLPVISTPNTGASRDLVEEGQTGFLVPADSPDALAEKMLALATNPKLRSTMGANARNKAAQLTPEARAKTMIETMRAG